MNFKQVTTIITSDLSMNDHINSANIFIFYLLPVRIVRRRIEIAYTLM